MFDVVVFGAAIVDFVKFWEWFVSMAMLESPFIGPIWMLKGSGAKINTLIII